MYSISWRALPAEFGAWNSLEAVLVVVAVRDREAVRRRGIVPVIPYRSNVKGQPAYFPGLLYRARARIEQLIGKLKRFKRGAMRCEKTQQNYAAFISLACVFILVKSVHRA